MRLTANLCTLTLKQLLGGACRAVGVPVGETAVDGVVGFLMRRFVDQSKRLIVALERSSEYAWRAVEVALAGDSLWDRCKLVLATGEERAFRDQVRPFLDACPLAELHGRQAFRQTCLEELRTARKAGLLAVGALDPADLARRTGAFARFSDPHAAVQAEAEALSEMGEDLTRAGFTNLAAFLALRPQRGEPLLVLAARYFFRRAVEEDTALFQGLAFARLEELQHGQEEGFRALHQALGEQGDRLERVLQGVAEVTAATHAAVLDVRAEQQRQGEHHHELYQAVLEVQGRLDLLHREVRPRDSLSLRSDAERALVKQLVSRYRALPEDSRRELPALLNAIGQLEVVAGEFDAAQRDFSAVAGLVADPQARAEAHHNAYRAALERRDWDKALAELREAARLDPGRFAPFPVDKYQPQRILGAGGFGVAFLCRHRFLNAEVVVKTLLSEDLDQDVDRVFAEAQALRQLDHPAIIRVQDCGFAGPDGSSRPYLVMDYFPGVTLDEAVRGQPLSVEDLAAVARQVAAGLQAAHGKGILHRDVKPANLLVRRPEGGTGWQARLIDFGLALRRTGRETMRASTNSLAGSSIAGTLDYAAPEQLGRLPDASPCPASDVFGFARTCCFALFGTPQPLLRHWRSVPPELAELLETCLEERPEQRPQDFGFVLERLERLAPDPAVAPPRPVVSLPVAPVATGRTIPVAEMTAEQRHQELAALAARVSDCTRCAQLARARTRTVFGTGPLDPDVCFLGEAPGADEDRQGLPFVGAAGQVLDRLLAKAGLKRDEVYIANILKCRPPGNRQPQPPEVANCSEYLRRQLELVRPKVICTLGGSAAQNLLATAETIGRLRGRFHDYKGIPVLCTYHPAFLLPGRSPERVPDVLRDFGLLLGRLGRSMPRA